ncbi:MAG TPA: DUF1302 family protein [Polyangiaceae bacterium]|nr:DUF1302 family protein [Polyangiaceae bacterium]
MSSSFTARPARAVDDPSNEHPPSRQLDPRHPGGAEQSESPARTESPDDKAVASPTDTPSGDVVESIEGDTATTSAPPPGMEGTSTPPNDELQKFELNGWARQTLELGFSNHARRDSQPEPGALPYDRFTSQSQLFVRARYARGRWFEAAVSGALTYSLFEQGTDSSSKSFNGFNGQSARGVLEPRLQELFIGLFADKFDFRIGQQRLAWGRGEFVSPNDVMNARDLRNPFVSETELRTLPTFLLRADLDLGFGSLQGVIAPVFTPDRFDVSDSNWAALQPDAPLWMRGLAGIARHSLDPTLQERAQRLLEATQYPKQNFTEPVLGARFAWSAGGVDVNHYYQYGFDGPLVSVAPDLREALTNVDWATAGLTTLQPLFAAIDAGQNPIRVRYERRHHVGLDAATTVGPIAIRLDTAYQSKRGFFRRDFTSVVSPSLQTVLALEYQTFDKNKLILIEGVYQRIMDTLPYPVLLYKLDSFAVAGTVRWPVWGAWGFDVRSIVGIYPRTLILQPELTFKPDPLNISLGGLWLDGAAFTLGDYYRRNREVYVKARYFF